MKKKVTPLAAMALCAAVCLPPEAAASSIYKMVGGKCLDSTRNVLIENDQNGNFVGISVGPKLCSDQATLTIVMNGNYTPGDFFFLPHPPVNDPLESIVFDADFLAFGTASLGVSRSTILIGYDDYRYGGRLPEKYGTAEAEFGFDHPFLYLFSDGTWRYDRVFSVVTGTDCGLGSTTGLIPAVGYCAPSQGYFSATGTYEALALVPEPGALHLAALSLMVMGVVARRKRVTST